MSRTCFRVNSPSIVAWMSRNSLTRNLLVCKRKLNRLAKLVKWLSCVVSTYLFGAFDCMFLLCHVRVSEWIHTLKHTNQKKTFSCNRLGIRYTDLRNIIQKKKKKRQQKVKNLRLFVLQMKTMSIEPDEIQVSCDVTNLYSSMPIVETTHRFTISFPFRKLRGLY